MYMQINVRYFSPRHARHIKLFPDGIIYILPAFPENSKSHLEALYHEYMSLIIRNVIVDEF